MTGRLVKKKWTTLALGVLIALSARLPEIGASQTLSIKEPLAALGKTPTLGSANAPVTIVEFSDFQCSFCKKFRADTLPQLKERYIKQGKVRFMY
ncbi:MAG: thioredoxin domain-containing protein, partial [Candidatus Binatia bacterium]